MMSVAEVLKELARIKRERVLVESSLASDEVKAKLLDVLSTREKALSLKTTPEPVKGK